MTEENKEGEVVETNDLQERFLSRIALQEISYYFSLIAEKYSMDKEPVEAEDDETKPNTK